MVKTRTLIESGAYLIVLFLFFLIIIGGIIDQPVGIAYVETDSMVPQLDPGDGFILIPSQLVDEYSVGDVITFEAENFPYDYVTHRIVGETPEGFITQGDNNTFTDQSGSRNEPYVNREQIAGRVVQWRGSVVAIPYLGSAVEYVSTTVDTITQRFFDVTGLERPDGPLGQVLFSLVILSIIAIVADIASSRIRSGSRPRTREKCGKGSPYVIYAAFILFIVLATSVSLLSMTQHNRIDVIATEGETNARAVHIGDTVTQHLEVRNSGFLPVYVHTRERQGIVTMSPDTMVLEGGLTKRIPYEVQAPDAPGYYQAYVSIDIYLGILPYDVTFALRDVHPYLPLIVIDVIAVLLSLPILVVLRNEAQRTERTRSRKRPVKTF